MGVNSAFKVLMQIYVYKNTKYFISLACRNVLQIYHIKQWKMELPLLRPSGSLATAWKSWSVWWSRVWRGQAAMKQFLYWQQISVYTIYLATLSLDILHVSMMTAHYKMDAWTHFCHPTLAYSTHCIQNFQTRYYLLKICIRLLAGFFSVRR